MRQAQSSLAPSLRDLCKTPHRCRRSVVTTALFRESPLNHRARLLLFQPSPAINATGVSQWRRCCHCCSSRSASASSSTSLCRHCRHSHHVPMPLPTSTLSCSCGVAASSSTFSAASVITYPCHCRTWAASTSLCSCGIRRGDGCDWCPSMSAVLHQLSSSFSPPRSSLPVLLRQSQALFTAERTPPAPQPTLFETHATAQP